MNMKKIIILFILCVFNVSGCFSHGAMDKHGTMDKKDYEKLVDYMNVKITGAYIENFISQPKDKNGREDSAAYKDRIVPVLKKNSLENPVQFDTLQMTLNRNRWSRVCKNVAKQYDSVNKAYYSEASSNDDLIDKLFNFELTKEQIKEHPATKNSWIKWKAEIKEHINKPKNTASTGISSDNKKTGTGSKQRNNTVFSGTGSGYIIIIAIIIIITVLLLYLHRKQGKSFEDKINRLKENSYNYELLLSKINNIETTLNKLLSDFGKQYNDITDLISKINTPVAKISEAEDWEQNSSAPDTPANGREIRQTVSKVFYLSTPARDGSFWDRNSREELDPTASYYRFVETEVGRAEFFTVETPEFFQQALRRPDAIIEPVCEAQNAWTNGKRIITETPGKAQKDGEKWKVTQKAKIRYE
jgi:hypothetical protein